MPDTRHGLPEDPREFGGVEWTIFQHFFGVRWLDDESEIRRASAVLNRAIDAIEELAEAIRPEGDKKHLLDAVVVTVLQMGAQSDA
jgi:hypothetical protein